MNSRCTVRAQARHRHGIVTAQTRHRRGMGTAQTQHRHGTGTAQSQHRHGTGMAQAWHRHSTGMAQAWHRHGTGMAEAWHSNSTVTVWSRHRHGIVTAQSRHSHGTGTARARHRHGTVDSSQQQPTAQSRRIVGAVPGRRQRAVQKNGTRQPRPAVGARCRRRDAGPPVLPPQEVRDGVLAFRAVPRDGRSNAIRKIVFFRDPHEFSGTSSAAVQTRRYSLEPSPRELSNGALHMPDACLYACRHTCLHACLYICLYTCLHARAVP